MRLLAQGYDDGILLAPQQWQHRRVVDVPPVGQKDVGDIAACPKPHADVVPHQTENGEEKDRFQHLRGRVGVRVRVTGRRNG